MFFALGKVPKMFFEGFPANLDDQKRFHREDHTHTPYLHIKSQQILNIS